MRIWRLTRTFPQGRLREWEPGGGQLAGHTRSEARQECETQLSNRPISLANVSATAWQDPSEDAQGIEVLTEREVIRDHL